MIQMYENILPENFCEYLIHKFESEESNLDKTHEVFDQLEINHWSRECKDILDLTASIYNDYKNRYDICNMMPEKKKIEGIRMKRYLPNVHSFPLHVDVANNKSCSRYLAFLFYLNNNEAGTKFYTPEGNLTYEAKCGNILVFPPMWMFPHEGLMPTENKKYIMSTYYHYAE